MTGVSSSTRPAVAYLKKADPILRDLIVRVGPCRLPKLDPSFTTLARNIVYQQLNGKAAGTIFQRLSDGLPGAILTAEGIHKARLDRLRSFGLSQQKAAYLKDLAARTVRGEIDYPALVTMPDAEVIATLTAVKGIGVWTAQMFLMFALNRRDILPHADFGIRAAMKNLYGLDEMPKPAEMDRIATPWRPYATAACWYLWRSLELPATNGAKAPIDRNLGKNSRP